MTEKISEIILSNNAKKCMDKYITKNIRHEKLDVTLSKDEFDKIKNMYAIVQKIEKNQRQKTKFKDKNNNTIFIGDTLYVQQYSDKSPKAYGQLKYKGIVELKNNEVVVTYYNYCRANSRSEYIKCFPKKYREILRDKTKGGQKMGYRHYFVTAPKKEIDELRLKSMDDFKNEFKSLTNLQNMNESDDEFKNLNCQTTYDNFDEYLYERLKLFKYGDKTIMELGKLYLLNNGQEYENRLLAKSKKVKFTDKQVEHYLTDENCLAICSKETLNEYIKCLSDLWLNYLENNLKDDLNLRIMSFKYNRKELGIFIEDTFMTEAQQIKDILKYNVIDFENEYLMLVAY